MYYVVSINWIRRVLLMAFLGNIGKKVGEAAQAAARKSSEIVEITKLNANISSEEDKIQKLYIQIGKAVYGEFVSPGEIKEDFKALCSQIAEHEQNIKALREKISEVKGIRQCINCGAELERSQIYCPKCGTKNEPAQFAEEPSQPAAVFCPSCGCSLDQNALFCTNCGTKVR
jgi:Zn finger protein HypA/HybF involved in hydrogenase expression